MNRKEAIIQICKEYQETKKAPADRIVGWIIDPVIGWVIIPTKIMESAFPLILSNSFGDHNLNARIFIYHGFKSNERFLELEMEFKFKELNPSYINDVFIIPEQREAYSVLIEFDNGLQIWLGVLYEHLDIVKIRAIEKLETMLELNCSRYLK